MELLKILVLLTVPPLSHAIPNYWPGQTFTTFNGTQHTPVPFTIESKNTEYNEKDSSRDLYLKNRVSSYTPIDLWDKTNDPPVNKTGTIHKVVLEKGFITHVEVLDERNYDNSGNVPVRICTTWLQEKKEESVDHDPFYLKDAMTTDTLLNITMKAGWKLLGDAEQAKIDKNRYWEIDDYLCHYEGTNAKIWNGKCVLPYSEVIKYFLALWKFPNYESIYAKANRLQVSNDLEYLKNYSCAKNNYPDITTLKPCNLSANEEEIEYLKPEDVWIPPIKTWYRYIALPLAMGQAVNLTYGHNKTTHAYDFNFTVIFEKWTFDFPEDFLSAYRDFSFLYDDLKFDMWYWRQDPPVVIPRTAPTSFFIMIIIIIFPTLVITTASVLLCMFRSKKGFKVKLWKFQRDRLKSGIDDHKHKVIKQKHLQKKVEKRKTKEFLEKMEHKDDEAGIYNLEQEEVIAE